MREACKVTRPNSWFSRITLTVVFKVEVGREKKIEHFIKVIQMGDNGGLDQEVEVV